ncbi:MAG: hypothetical protein RLZ98_3725 [Pseudomonadota bacterium]|jgi:membrane protein
MTRYRPLFEAIYRLYEHSGFTMAGAVAFSFVLSLFPFCIFIAALSGVFGGRELADIAIQQLFELFPRQVAEGLAPEVIAVLGRTRIELVTLSALIALFFATSAIETLRAALNNAYRIQEQRPYLLCLALSMLLVLLSAVTLLVLAWFVLVGPAVAAALEPAWLARLGLDWVRTVLYSSSTFALLRYAAAAIVISAQLFAIHLWLAAGRRTLIDVWPGVLLSVLLWLALAGVYSYYIGVSDYSRFYAGLSHLMVALIFFQVTAVIVILGAELNRGLIELRKINQD